MKKHKILFLLKKQGDTTGYPGSRAGLFNSATFIANYLNDTADHPTAAVDIAVDGDDLDRLIHKHRPNMIVLEAIWCPPYKIAQIGKLHPEIKWVVRTHSKVSFLANEGLALDWLDQCHQLGENVMLAFNSKSATEDFIKLGYQAIYLPNIYYPSGNWQFKYDDVHKHVEHIPSHALNVGCFGAIRPMKNHLNQAIAAIEYANQKGLELYFHINIGEEDGNGEQILKNLRSLFNLGRGHHLVEWPWFEHPKFLNVLRFMDFGMQVSLSESFNIVTADFVHVGVPIVVSKDIDWMPDIFKAEATSTTSMQEVIKIMNFSKKLTAYTNQRHLQNYNTDSEHVWLMFLRYHFGY